jgi:hypothetical protein
MPTEQQIPKLAAVLVEHQKHFSRMSTEDAQWVIQNAERAIKIFAEAIRCRHRQLEPLKAGKLVIEAVSAVYPDWVKKRLTPDLEAEASTGITNPQLWLHDRQRAGQHITGNEIYAFLLPDQETCQLQENDLICHCISLADIQFYEKYPYLIPSEWNGRWISAWKSVVLNNDGYRDVPCLRCDVGEPFVHWSGLGRGWRDYELACLYPLVSLEGLVPRVP